MPTYNFRNNATKKEWSERMSMSERETFLNDNPDVEQLIVFATPQVDAQKLGRMKPDDNFRDILREVKKKSPGSNMNIM